jgi:class 3 adenylate cyclase
MFSDIVGYAAIMGRDEREGLRAVLPQFNGRLIGEIGDGSERARPAEGQPRSFDTLAGASFAAPSE